MSADLLEAQFTQLLKTLDLRVESVKRVSRFAMQHGGVWAVNILGLLMSEMRRAEVSSRVKLLYVLDSICQRDKARADSNRWERARFIPHVLEMLPAVVRLVLPQGVAARHPKNALALQKVASVWASRNIFPPSALAPVKNAALFGAVASRLSTQLGSGKSINTASSVAGAIVGYAKNKSSRCGLTSSEKNENMGTLSACQVPSGSSYSRQNSSSSIERSKNSQNNTPRTEKPENIEIERCLSFGSATSMSGSTESSTNTFLGTTDQPQIVRSKRKNAFSKSSNTGAMEISENSVISSGKKDQDPQDRRKRLKTGNFQSETGHFQRGHDRRRKPGNNKHKELNTTDLLSAAASALSSSANVNIPRQKRRMKQISTRFTRGKLYGTVHTNVGSTADTLLAAKAKLSRLYDRNSKKSNTESNPINKDSNVSNSWTGIENIKKNENHPLPARDVLKKAAGALRVLALERDVVNVDDDVDAGFDSAQMDISMDMEGSDENFDDEDGMFDDDFLEMWQNSGRSAGGGMSLDLLQADFKGDTKTQNFSNVESKKQNELSPNEQQKNSKQQSSNNKSRTKNNLGDSRSNSKVIVSHMSNTSNSRSPSQANSRSKTLTTNCQDVLNNTSPQESIQGSDMIVDYLNKPPHSSSGGNTPYNVPRTPVTPLQMMKVTTGSNITPGQQLMLRTKSPRVRRMSFRNEGESSASGTPIRPGPPPSTPVTQSSSWWTKKNTPNGGHTRGSNFRRASTPGSSRKSPVYGGSEQQPRMPPPPSPMIGMAPPNTPLHGTMGGYVYNSHPSPYYAHHSPFRGNSMTPQRFPPPSPFGGSQIGGSFHGGRQPPNTPQHYFGSGIPSAARGYPQSSSLMIPPPSPVYGYSARMQGQYGMHHLPPPNTPQYPTMPPNTPQHHPTMPPNTPQHPSMFPPMSPGYQMPPNTPQHFAFAPPSPHLNMVSNTPQHFAFAPPSPHLNMVSVVYDPKSHQMPVYSRIGHKSPTSNTYFPMAISSGQKSVNTNVTMLGQKSVNTNVTTLVPRSTGNRSRSGSLDKSLKRVAASSTDSNTTTNVSGGRMKAQ